MKFLIGNIHIFMGFWREESGANQIKTLNLGDKDKQKFLQ